MNLSQELDAQGERRGGLEPGSAGGLNRLTAAVDAAAGAVHHFDEVIAVLVDAHAMEDFLQTLVGTVHDADMHVVGLAAERLDGHRDRRFNDGVVVAADDFNVGLVEFLAGEREVGGAERRFHNAAGAAENRAGTGINLERSTFAGPRRDREP